MDASAQPVSETLPRVTEDGLVELGLAWESVQEWGFLDWRSLYPFPKENPSPSAGNSHCASSGRMSLAPSPRNLGEGSSPCMLSVGQAPLWQVFYILRFYL